MQTNKFREFYQKMPKISIATVKSQKIYQTSLLPKGVRQSPINLKCCLPNGMPIIVIQSKTPKTRCVKAIHMPPQKIHSIFIHVLKQPAPLFPSLICRPKGIKVAMPILMHWSPNGIPIIVQHSSMPPIMYPRKTIKPPKINHIRFPSRFMIFIH